MSNIYDDMIELLQQEQDQCAKSAAANSNSLALEDNEYAAGYLAGLRQSIILVKAAKIAVVQIPHLGEVS